MLAHGSRDILENAKVYDDFYDCIKDLDYIVGTTARKRTPKSDYITPAQIRKSLLSKSDQINKAGIIFGTEESGLPNEILLHCDVASTIPLVHSYPSLNLSQAAMLFAYELSGLEPIVSDQEDPEIPSYSELKARINSIMDIIEIPEQMPLRGRILERLSMLGSDDINLLHSLSSRIMNKLGNKKE